MYIPVPFQWVDSSDYNHSDMVGFYFEDAGGSQTQMVSNIPFGQLEYEYVGFHGVLPGDYDVHMTVNGVRTGEVIACHLTLPSVIWGDSP